MFAIFASPDQLIKEDEPDRLVLARLNRLHLWGAFALTLAVISLGATWLVGLNPIGVVITVLYAGLGLWLVSSKRTIIFDTSQQQVFFLTRFLLCKRVQPVILYEQIDSIYLDYEEHAHPAIKNLFYLEQRVWRKWFVFLTLTDAQTMTVAHHQKSYSLGQEPNLFKETLAWEKLASRICAVTDKLLIETASVPSQAPRTFIDVVDQIIQRRLAQLPDDDDLTNQTIRLRSHPTGSLEIIVNGQNYKELSDVPNTNIRDLIQSSVEEWHGLNGRSKTTSLFSTGNITH